MKLEKILKKVAVAYLGAVYQHLPGGDEKTHTRNLSEYGWSPGRDLNVVPLQCKAVTFGSITFKPSILARNYFCYKK
jgi:hypothetical protein